MERIRQFIPADGWSAVFTFRDEDTSVVGLYEVNSDQDDPLAEAKLLRPEILAVVEGARRGER